MKVPARGANQQVKAPSQASNVPAWFGTPFWSGSWVPGSKKKALVMYGMLWGRVLGFEFQRRVPVSQKVLIFPTVSAWGLTEWIMYCYA